MEGQFYSIRDLYLFKEYTRATYTAEFTTQPPPFKIGERIKRWFDPSCDPSKPGAGPYNPSAIKTYLVWDQAAQRQRSISMTAKEAWEVNLPGRYTYAKYTSPVSVATVIGPDGSKYPFNHRYLLSQAQVDELLAKINSDLGRPGLYTAVEVTDASRFPWRVIWGEEVRRQFALARNNDLNTTKEGALVWEKYVSSGIGAPGKFNEIKLGSAPNELFELGWTSEIPIDEPHNTLPEIPVPMRELRSDERVQQSPFGDMVYSINEVALPATTKDIAGITALLKEILAAIKGPTVPPFVGS